MGCLEEGLHWGRAGFFFAVGCILNNTFGHLFQEHEQAHRAFIQIKSLLMRGVFVFDNGAAVM